MSYQHCRLCVPRQAYGVGILSLYIDTIQSHRTLFLLQMCSCFAIHFWQYHFFSDCRALFYLCKLKFLITFKISHLFKASSCERNCFPLFLTCVCVFDWKVEEITGVNTSIGKMQDCSWDMFKDCWDFGCLTMGKQPGFQLDRILLVLKISQLDYKYCNLTKKPAKMVLF